MARPAASDRVVVLAPTARDGPVTAGLLRNAGISAVVAPDVNELCALLDQGAAAALVADEALAHGGGITLRDWLCQQEPWSDLPVVLFTAAGAGATARSPGQDLLAEHGNVTLLDRPVRVITLLSAVSAALRARRRQYRMRDLLAELGRSVRARDQFLAMLGHELRNPIGAIHTATELIVRNPAALERNTSIIARQSRKLARLVDDLLEVSRVDSGKVALQRKVLDLREPVDRSIEAMVPRALQAGLRLERAIPERSAPVDGDPVRLEQVVGNLLANAVKYTPAGGEIRVLLDRRSAEVSLRVTDTGIGISPELLDRIFEPFIQATSSLERSEGGLGLGLALVRGLVALHGGTVEARSAGPGKGAEFEVVLPLATQGDLALLPRVPEPAAPGARRHVLVVEDNPDNRETLVMLLESFGHEVVVASDGPSGVRAGVASHPEVAIVDIGLPGFDGFEVGRRLREALGRNVTLVALTGYGQAEDRDRARQAGFDVHLTKPAEASLIADVVERAPLRAWS